MWHFLVLRKECMHVYVQTEQQELPENLAALI